jgi:hypothetical protein
VYEVCVLFSCVFFSSVLGRVLGFVRVLCMFVYTFLSFFHG